MRSEVKDETALMLESQGAIRAAVSGCRRTWPFLDRDELIGECQLIALRGVRKFQPEKGMKLFTWIYGICTQFIIAGVRCGAWRRRFCMGGGDVEDHDPLDREHFHLKEFMNDLSDKAATAARLGLALEKKGTLLEFLRSNLRWEQNLIVQVFTEIQEAL